MNAWVDIPVPINVIPIALNAGSILTKRGEILRNRGEEGDCLNQFLAYTNVSPNPVKTADKPRLKAMTKINPNAVLLTAIAPNNSTSAAGQGKSPPEIPKASRDGMLTPLSMEG